VVVIIEEVEGIRIVRHYPEERLGLVGGYGVPVEHLFNELQG
jgi:hypothetical protein